MALVVKSFTISKLMETSARGEKQSEFLSMRFESDISLTPEQALVQQLEAHRTVEEALVFNALASGLMTKESAKDRLEQVKERHVGVLAALQKKYGIPDVSAFLDPPKSEEPEGP
jgi:hypothetical protein